MTTNAKEHERQDNGAPQSGGMSGVAAQPGEGALDTPVLAFVQAMADQPCRTRRDGFDNCIAQRDYVRTGAGSYAWSYRQKIANGESLCETCRARDALAAPAPSSPRAECCCAILHDGPCGDARVTPPRAEAPEAEPADAAALDFDDVQTLHAAASDLRFVASGGTCDPRTLAEHADALLAIAALRRAAPGAAPEREARSVDALLEVVADGLLPASDVRGSGARVALGVIHDRLATPAPTGERAGGEEELTREDVMEGALDEAADELLAAQRALVLLANQLETHSIPFAPDAEVETFKARQAVAEYERLLALGTEAAMAVFHAKRPAPVAAPRGTEGQDDAR